MLKRVILPVLLAGVAFAGGFGFITAGGIGALAHEGEHCGTSATDSPFMGMADPNAPYDLRFIDEMVMHHRGAIMSSEMMITDSKHPELRDLARRIQESQQHQIDQMVDWRAEWYPDAATPTMRMETGTGVMGGMMDGNGMMGGMMRGMMNGEMAASSISVVLNALRLNTYQLPPSPTGSEPATVSRPRRSEGAPTSRAPSTSQEEDVMGQHHEQMPTDPVCGMQVDPEHAAGTSEYNGEVVYFCSAGCKQQFDQGPRCCIAE